MSRTAVIFEMNPRPPQPWVEDVCHQLGLTLVAPDDVARAMARDERAREALLRTHGEDPALAPHYARGLDAVAGHATKVALHSVSWLAYRQEAAAVVVDLSGVEDERSRAAARGLPAAEVEGAIAAYRRKLEDRLETQGPPAQRRLFLEAGLPDAEKVRRAVGFLRPLVG